MKVSFGARVLFTLLGCASLGAQELKTDFESLMEYGLAKGRLLTQNRRSLSEAQDQIATSLSILNSSIGANVQLSSVSGLGGQSTQGGASAGPGQTETTESVSLNLRPLDMLSISAKAGSDGSLSASTSVSPFASTNKVSNATRNLADVQFDVDRFPTLFKKSFIASYEKWSTAYIQKEIRAKERENAMVLMDQSKAKFELGVVTEATYQKTENVLIQAKKNEISAISAERNSRISLLVSIGFSNLATEVFEPELGVDQSIFDKIKILVDSNQEPKPSDNYLNAKRALDRATEDEKTFLTFFSGLSLDAQVSANTKQPNSKAQWSIGLGLNLSGTDLSGAAIRESQRSIQKAREAFEEAELLEKILADSKKQDLALQLSYFESASLAFEQAKQNNSGDRVKFENGTMSKLDLVNQEIEVLNAQNSYFQAYFDLYLLYIDF